MVADAPLVVYGNSKDGKFDAPDWSEYNEKMAAWRDRQKNAKKINLSEILNS